MEACVYRRELVSARLGRGEAKEREAGERERERERVCVCIVALTWQPAEIQRIACRNVFFLKVLGRRVVARVLARAVCRGVP